VRPEWITRAESIANKVYRTDKIKQYVKAIGKDLGVDYHVISVFGSQSTGKSTLLNRLFHTRFDVMNEKQRQQTTKGIWLGFSPKVGANVGSGTQQNILVMDVEGSDGRERGEDQDFERKAALFALSTSEVLIVNIWEHQVGLYQGANMGLLKTVFEVNLSLFSDKSNKVLLLFVIRDHYGSTPLENLSNTLTTDLVKMWDNISKPSNVPQDCTLFDYFDLEFTALAHKVLQPEKFEQDVRDLGDRFVVQDEKYFFKKDYKQNFPIDGWTLYSENCWNLIQSNKDLDLPTQQILVARFRCDEIVKESLELFNDQFNKEFQDIKHGEVKGAELASSFIKLSDFVLGLYDSQASHYHSEVYNDKRRSLIVEVHSKFKIVVQAFIKELKKASLILLNDSLNTASKSSFLERSSSAKEKALKHFTDNLSPITEINPQTFDFTEDLGEFTQDLEQELIKIKEVEIQNLINRIVKKNFPIIKSEITEVFTDSSNHEELWDDVLKIFKDNFDNSLSAYRQQEGSNYDFKIESSLEKNVEIFHKLEKSFWISFDRFIHEYLTEDSIVNILRRKFEDSFNYDPHGIPRVWKNELEISKIYKEATDSTLRLLPILSLAKLSNGSEIIPDEPIFEDDFDEDGDLHRFSHILNSTQQLKVKRQFLKQSEINYRDASRSIISNVYKIPPFIYVLLIVLGWNEFVAILKNPLYLILTILLGTGFFFVNALNLWGPLETTANVIIHQAKNYLADTLLNDGQIRTRPPGSSDVYELEDLSEKKIE
jgi:hypothetical protein